MLLSRVSAAALLGVSCLGLSAPERVATFVTYVLEEKTSSTTPNGERISALAGRVSVAGERARLELSSTTFPRARGSLLLLDGSKAVLLDEKERDGARLDVSEVPDLFAARAGDEAGGAGVRLREKNVQVSREGAGPSFQELPTSRYRVTVSAWVNVTTPGRVATIHDVTRGFIDTVAMPEASSPLDDITRLFRARGEVKDALAEELLRVEGFAIRVRLESEREMTAEAIGATAPHNALDRPMKTTVRAERNVRELVRRPLAKRDLALFTVPEEVRLFGPERLVRDDFPAR